MYLEQLVEISTLENINMECKARLNRNDVAGWIKTIAGFSNAEGGSFFIGVEDKTNKLIGFSRREADNERNFSIIRSMSIYFQGPHYGYPLSDMKTMDVNYIWSGWI